MIVLDAGAGKSPYRNLFKHAKYEAADFAARVIDRLSGLDAQRIGQFILTLDKAVHAVLEHVAAFIARHTCHRLGGGHRDHEQGEDLPGDVLRVIGAERDDDEKVCDG